MTAAAVLQPPGSGFVPDPGTNFTVGQEPALAAALGRLGRALGVTIYGISGYRTPAHSIAVGGSANDPHTRGLAVDIGVNSQLRASAGQITNAQLARYGLYRPFDQTGNDPTEINHIQILPSALKGLAEQQAAGGNAFGAVGNAVGSAAGAIGSGASSVYNVVTNPGGDIKTVLGAVFSGFFDWVKSNLMRAALYGLLIATGATLTIYGIDKTFTARPAGAPNG